MKQPLFLFLILTTTLVSGLNFPIGKMGLAFSTPFLLLAVRFIAAGLIMLPFVARRPHPQTGREWLRIAVIGLFQSALVLGGIYLSLQTIEAGTSSILSSTNPIWSIVFGALLFGFRYSLLQWLGVLIGFAGVIVTQGFQFQWKYGILFALLAGMAWGLATLLTGRWGKQLDVWVMTAYQMLCGGVILLIASFFLEHPRMEFHVGTLAQEVFVLAWLIVMSSIVQFLTWFYVLQHYPPEKASAYLFLVPLFGVLSSCLLLGEPIHWYVAAGAACIGLGIYLVNKPKSITALSKSPG
jgi:drug/metabolite transporter (DMT)-like permease